MTRLLDLVLATLGLVAAAPVLVVAALAIIIEDGLPVIYRSVRVGRDGVVFDAYKLRTMRVDADEALDSRGHVADGAVRVTRCGRRLRALSVDELPQLLNVLRGEMSVVGPRPMLPEMAARLTAEQRARFAVRPGVTGLAQVSGRNQLPWSRRLELDVRYVRSRSIGLDLSILLRTILVVSTGRGHVSDRNPEQVDDLPRQPDSGAL